MRVVIHGHHPNENTTDSSTMGKVIHLTDSIEDLLELAGITPLLEGYLQKFLNISF